MPLPRNSRSFLQPMGLGWAPVARITVLPSYTFPRVSVRRFTGPESSALAMVAPARWTPNFSACLVMRAVRVAPDSSWSTICPG